MFRNVYDEDYKRFEMQEYNAVPTVRTLWPYYRLPATEYTATNLDAFEHDVHQLTSVVHAGWP